MSRIFTDGFESQDLRRWVQETGAPTIVTTPVYNPNTGRSLKLTTNGSYVVRTAPFSALSELYAALHVRLSTGTLGTSGPALPFFRSGSTLMIVVRVNYTSGLLQAEVGSSVVATGVTVVTRDAWHRIEVYTKIANSGGRITVKLNGTTEIDFTGDTQPSSETTVDRLCLYHSTSAGGADAYIDDVIVNNVSGADNNSWPGEQVVALLRAKAVGAMSEWTPTDTGGTDNPTVPVDSAVDIIVDDEGAGFSVVSGTWTVDAGAPTSAYGLQLRYNAAGSGADKVRWTPTLPTTDYYEVFAWWYAFGNRATDAPFTIYTNGGGSTTIDVNQQLNGSQWVSLGVFELDPATAKVELTDDANGFVIADAVRFVRTGAAGLKANFVRVNELPQNESAYVTTNVVDKIDTYLHVAMPTDALTVACVTVVTLARKVGAPTPQNIAGVVRIASTNYASADVALPGTDTPLMHSFGVNPATGVAWTVSDVNAAEFGMKSRA